MGQQSRRSRTRTVGVEVRGNGVRALLAAIVLQAVIDAQRSEPAQQEAHVWLRSRACRAVLEELGIPYRRFLDALHERRLRRGTSTRAYWEDVFASIDHAA